MAEEFVSLTTHEVVPYTDTRIVKIQEKVVQTFNDQLSLRGESYSQYVVFEIDRYYDGIDLTNNLLLQISYQRPDGLGDNCPAVNVSYSDEHVRFAWLVPPAATAIAGKLRVMPFAYGEINNKRYILKTAYVEYQVGDTIELEEFVDEPDDSWYKQFLDQIAKIGDFTDAINSVLANAETAQENAEIAVSAAEATQELKEQVTRSAEDAADSAERAEKAVNNGSYLFFHIDENGDLICQKIGEANADFYLSDGDLYVRTSV